MAGVAMAGSPGFVCYGRYSIHEIWLVLFSMLFILGLLGLRQFGTNNYLWCAGMGAAGMILSKETYIIHIGCALIAFPVLSICHWLRPIPGKKPARQSWSYVDLAMVIVVAVALVVFFYSGTFLHWSGVKGLYQAYAPWFTTGSEGHGHEKPWSYWLKVMAASL
jgi:predicted membrane-bound mannosyltransferase